MQLEGKVAAVTGGSRSIGRALVEAFLKEGARVAFNGRDQAKGDRAIKELAVGDRAWFCQGDARESKDVKRLVDGTVARFGRIDIMVNNAGGITKPAVAAELDDDAWNNDIAWNLSSTFYGTKSALAYMVPQKSGRIINISSVEGKIPMPGMVGYVAAKHGVNGLTKAVAMEVGQLGITVNAICPGLVITDAVMESGPSTAAAMGMTLEEMTAAFLSKTMTGALNTFAEISAVAVLLATDLATGITGATFSVDSGMAPY